MPQGKIKKKLLQNVSGITLNSKKKKKKIPPFKLPKNHIADCHIACSKLQHLILVETTWREGKASLGIREPFTDWQDTLP